MNEINVADAINNREWKSKKYFLCFGFENFLPLDLDKFHVTLIYLGAEKGASWKTGTPYEWNVNDLVKLVDDYIEKNRFVYSQKIFKVSFSMVAMFGRNKDIRVLLPHASGETINISFRKDLYDLVTEKFSCTQESQFPFRPHLTTDLSYFESKIDKLFLCSQNYEVVESWDLE